jgi:outer membrane lipoprotein-sorting protein
MTRSLPRIIIHTTVALLVLAGGAVAIASRSGAESPPPDKPLAQAVQDALAAPAPEGISGRLEFSNRLVDSAAVPRGHGNALLTGAEGRFWVAGDGRARLELQSPAGDAQVRLDDGRVELYDPASNTAYVMAVPEREDEAEAAPGVADIERMLGGLARSAAIGDAEPGTVAGEAAYTVRIAPRHDGGLVGAAELAWDAANGVPLRAAVYAQGEQEPVLELKATEIEFGPVAEADVAIQRPADARVVEIADAPGGAQGAGRMGRRGDAETVQSQLSFPLSAPGSLAGLPRRSIRTLRTDAQTGAVVTYGKGLGAVLVIQAPAGADTDAGLNAGPGLQELSIDGTTAYELATALGTVIEFERDGVAYTVVGSVPPAAAEAAARAL